MIVEGITSLAFKIIGGLFNGFQIISLPTDLIQVLLDVMNYGAWIIGADLLALTFTSIIFWLGIKLTLGLVLFVWRLLPLT